VEELKKHIAIDIYGKCGSLKCDNKSNNVDNLNPPTGCCKLDRFNCCLSLIGIAFLL